MVLVEILSQYDYEPIATPPRISNLGNYVVPDFGMTFRIRPVESVKGAAIAE
jgi:hypothetical protein